VSIIGIAKLDLGYVLGGESFLTLPYGKFYSVAFAERTEPLTLDSRVVHKNVLSAVPLDKAVPFLIDSP